MSTELPDPTPEDLARCAELVEQLGFNQGHDWTTATDGSNFRYCRRCHEPGWLMPPTDKEE